MEAGKRHIGGHASTNVLAVCRFITPGVGCLGGARKPAVATGPGRYWPHRDIPERVEDLEGAFHAGDRGWQSLRGHGVAAASRPHAVPIHAAVALHAYCRPRGA